jgi:predicted pyridoxine 5'-phosphate oxidase superfamily flavin-nucleotide-binding protein
VANIASPQTVLNIKHSKNVCISFIDILLQKGFQLKGKARIIEKTKSYFLQMKKVLTEMTGGNLPFSTITEITLEQVKSIIAPKYILYPETTEKEQIESAKNIYGI